MKEKILKQLCLEDLTKRDIVKGILFCICFSLFVCTISPLFLMLTIISFFQIRDINFKEVKDNDVPFN